MGPLEHTAVHDILEYRINRSSLELPRMGSHSLRHSLAVHLMRRGVALKAIGDVLGHRDPESASVYLRLAVDDLREVGLPVPRGGAIVSLDPTGWRASLPRVRSARTTPLDSIIFSQ